MKHAATRVLSVLLALVLLLSMLPAAFAAGVLTNEERLIQALTAAVAPTNAILDSHQYAPNGKIAEIVFDRDALVADVVIYDTEKRAIKMLEVPFLKTLFSYQDIYALQIGKDLVEYESLNQFDIMLAVGHNTIGRDMSYADYYLWLRNQADTLTISSMDGYDVDITVICRTDRDDPDTEYSVKINLRIYNRYHKITWKLNNGEPDYVRDKLSAGDSISLPYGMAINDHAPAGMKFFRWDPDVPAVMGTTDLEFNAVWIPTDHAGYEVRHRLQNPALSGYDLVETEYFSAKTGSSVVGSDKAKTFDGFKLNTLPDNTKTYVIAADGTTKINLYYDRINVKITWDWGFKKLNRNVKYGLMPEAPEMPTPPDDGREYVFVRWDKEIVPATEPATYRARYADDKTLVLTLDAAGGSVSEDKLYLYLGETLGALPTPTREGHTFLGWFYQDGTPVDPDRVVDAEGEETIVAHWMINQYTIYFDTDGGTDIPSMTLDYGAVITPPEDPTRAGCLFLGWSPLLPYKMPAKPLFVTAQWHIHNPVPMKAVAPTCTEAGNTAYYDCASCDMFFSDESCEHEIAANSWVIPALGHNFQPGTVVTPSCIEAGYTVYACTRCSATENRDPVPAHGHVWNAGEVTTPATANSDGVKTFTCTVCGSIRTEVIPATGGEGCLHSASHAEHKDATCTEAGYDRTVCNACGLYLSETVIPALGHNYVNHAAQAATCTDVGWNAYIECSRCHDSTYVEIPALNHDYVNHAAKAATCTEAGWNAYQTCSRCDYTSYEEIAALGHNIVADAGKAATCTASGLTAGEHCTRCDYRIVQDVIPALGHDYVITAATAATCTTGGSATYTCSRCKDSYTETYARLGHDFKVTVVAPTCTERGYTFYECQREGCGYTEKGNWTNALGHQHAYPDHKDATCTEAGYDRMICDDCGAIIENTVIPALGHDIVTDPAVPATCTEPGLTAGEHCSRCDYKVEPQTVPALGHDIVADPAVPATCTEPGLTAGEHCSRCDYKVAQEILPALGHRWDDGKVTTPATAAKDGVKTFTCTVCGATRTEVIPATGDRNPFTDVSKSAYYYDAVLWAVGHEPQITNGTSATTFSPNAPCTRGQVVAFLWRTNGCPEPESRSNPFRDVKTTDYFYKAVLWAAENGITTGTSATTFSPNAPCTRAHVVTFLWRAQGEPQPKSQSNPFRDVASGQYYTTAVLWAVSHEPQITNGTGATTFSPNAACTRGQIVTFLYRAVAE